MYLKYVNILKAKVKPILLLKQNMFDFGHFYVWTFSNGPNLFVKVEIKSGLKKIRQVQKLAIRD